MGLSQWLSVLVIGLIAGWLSSLFMRVKGLGLFGYVVVGVVGAMVGSWVLGTLGIHLGGGLQYSVLSAFIGAVLVLALVGALKR